MSKSETPLEDINLESVWKDQNKPSFAEDCPINAFDTETSDGRVFMVSFAFEDQSGVLGNRSVDPLSAREIFGLLTHYKARTSAINFWYNLDFDANAILGTILTNKELTEIQIKNETVTEIGDKYYEITYVKGKFLKIRELKKTLWEEEGEKQGEHNYEHFDVSQFFFTSLDNAAEEWLGKNKKEDIETEKFGVNPCELHESIEQDCSDCWNKKQAINYIQNNYTDIKQYAEKDALLTQELSKELVSQAEDLDIPMGKPFSTGYLSGEYLRANTDEKPRFHKFDYQNEFWKAYYGGRFEVFERGNVGEVVAPDINSAYPAIMQNLPAPESLLWSKFSNVETDNAFESLDTFDFETICEHDYGVVTAQVNTDPNARIQPFAQKRNGKVEFPVLSGDEVTVIKPIFEFAVKEGIVLNYSLKEAYLANERDETTYPFEFIGDMYADRKVFENLDGKKKKGKLFKIVLNSGYGKTCQSTIKYRIVNTEDFEGGTFDLDELDGDYKLQPRQYLSKEQRKHLDENDVILKEQTAGRRFNPFFAAYITGMTRLELHKQVVQNDLVEDTVMFATDCIMVKEDAYGQSDFDGLINVPDTDMPREQYRKKAKESLGYWDFDYAGEAFVVGSGVYEVELEDGGTYTKTRGFTEKDLPKSLKEMARDNPNGIPIESYRPLTIGEVLISPEDGNISQFVKSGKELLPDFDTKRNWKRDNPTFADLLESPETSTPKDPLETQERMHKAVQDGHSVTHTPAEKRIAEGTEDG